MRLGTVGDDAGADTEVWGVEGEDAGDVGEHEAAVIVVWRCGWIRMGCR